MVKLISSSIKKLNQKEQLVMQLIYVEDLNTNEVAEVLDISKARVSQIHSSCLLKIKTDLHQD